MMFSTYDVDNDQHGSLHCAAEFGSGFWYNSCYCVSVNCEHEFKWYENCNSIGWFVNGKWIHLQTSRVWVTCYISL